MLGEQGTKIQYRKKLYTVGYHRRNVERQFNSFLGKMAFNEFLLDRNQVMLTKMVSKLQKEERRSSHSSEC